MFGILGFCLSNCGEEEQQQPPVTDTAQVTEPLSEPPAPEAKQDTEEKNAPAVVPEEPQLTPEQRYNNGEEAPVEVEAAIAWYTEFAEAGIADASYKLGKCYYDTRSIPMNFVKAVEHFRAAAEKGHPEARAKLAECYELGVGVEADPDEAAKWKAL